MDGSTQATPIFPGQQWAKPKDGPWGGYFPPVTITDVREGWVRYDMPGFSDNRMEEIAFRAIYKPIEFTKRGAA